MDSCRLYVVPEGGTKLFKIKSSSKSKSKSFNQLTKTGEFYDANS